MGDADDGHRAPGAASEGRPRATAPANPGQVTDVALEPEQGHVNVDRQTLARGSSPGSAGAPLCTIVMATGTIFASPWILWALIPFAALGSIFPRHPFDYIYNLGVRRLTGTPSLPTHGAPRRFACGVATIWLLATGAAFAADLEVAGYVLGGILTSVAALVSTTHFCIPSFVCGLLFGRPTCAAEES